MALVRVRYKGLSDVRVMSKKDLADAGVGVDGKLEWNRDNRHTVVIDGMSERLEEILRSEGTFTIEEVDEETGRSVKTIVKGEPLDDTGAIVRDGTTGEQSERPSGGGETSTTGSTGRGRSTRGS